MTNPDELLRLAERVEAGSGNDRTLDGDISEVFNPDGWKPQFIRGQAWMYSSSIDAVDRLRLRLLPGSQYTISTTNNCAAHVWLDHLTEYDHAGHAETAPRAFLAALLRAHAETVGG
ncbi:hypothetical protein AB4037_23280 [Labrys sp. KB_33_2]|uniref:hypothetical protein n=1 Tax=Labrys sp. KB_33_2 TaxID=3237479 RepID=UPI003F8DEF2E